MLLLPGRTASFSSLLSERETEAPCDDRPDCSLSAKRPLSEVGWKVGLLRAQVAIGRQRHQLAGGRWTGDGREPNHLRPVDVHSFPGRCLASPGCVPTGGAAGPCQEGPGVGTQDRMPSSRTNIAVLSGAILSVSQGEQLGTGKGRSQEHGGSLGAQILVITDSCPCASRPQDTGLWERMWTCKVILDPPSCLNPPCTSGVYFSLSINL